MDVLQAFAVCAYGNRFLQDSTIDRPSEMRVQHSTFKTVIEVGFERKGIGANYGSEGVAPWLKRMRHEGVERLSILVAGCEPETKGQTAPWGILSDSERGLELWQPLWRKRMNTHPHDLTPWLVVYSGDRFNRWNLTPPAPLEAAHTRISSTLESLLMGCQRGNFSSQLKQPLTRCLELHNQGDTQVMVTPDLCPPGFPPELQALVASAVRITVLAKSPLWTDCEVAPTVVQHEVGALWTSAMVALESVGHQSGYAERAAA